MNVAKLRAAHSINAAAPQIIALLASQGFTAARYFTGTGDPSSTTLPTGNGKYNAAQSGYVVSATVSAGGTGYAAGDVLTGSGGTGTACQITVDAVSSAGAITDCHVSTVGAYSVYPTNAVSVTGGSGSGATFNLDFPAPDFYLDLTTPTSPVLWICTTAGSKSTAVWNQLTSGGGSSVQMFHVKSIHDDYLTCRTWDGTTEGDTDVNVAKCYNCRRSYTHQIVDGVDYTFTYASDNQRTSSDGTNSQVEVVYPRYTTYSAPSAGYHPPGTIFAFKSVNNTGVQVSGVDVEWVEERRLWLRKYA